MGKKKNLKDLDEFEYEFIEKKMKGDSALNYLTSCGLATQLKTLSYKVDVKCKNEKQKEFLNVLKNDKNQICFGIGAPGTGKSYISLAFALKELKESKYSNIIMIVPTAPAGGIDLNLGYLKGDFDEKTRPFKECDEETITKILRNCGNYDPQFTARNLINGGYIRYEFINYVLGKTFDNSLILVNEAEQYTKENMKLLLTRLGENSKVVITGDCEQVNRRDIVSKKSECGLAYAASHLENLEEVGITEFTREDIVRNPLITKILDNWD
jgi:phosphate starvation-inducible PhoH-like protein